MKVPKVFKVTKVPKVLTLQPKMVPESHNSYLITHIS
jgi:hypothetical protein